MNSQSQIPPNDFHIKIATHQPFPKTSKNSVIRNQASGPDLSDFQTRRNQLRKTISENYRIESTQKKITAEFCQNPISGFKRVSTDCTAVFEPRTKKEMKFRSRSQFHHGSSIIKNSEPFSSKSRYFDMRLTRTSFPNSKLEKDLFRAETQTSILRSRDFKNLKSQAHFSSNEMAPQTGFELSYAKPHQNLGNPDQLFVPLKRIKTMPNKRHSFFITKNQNRELQPYSRLQSNKQAFLPKNSNFPWNRYKTCYNGERPIISVPKLSSPLHFLFPFTRSSRAIFEISQRPEIFPVSFRLKNLRRLIGSIFLWEGHPKSHLTRLNQIESEILLKIFCKKKYDNKIELISKINDPDSSIPIQIFRKMTRLKRKEENLKFSFRILFECLQKKFIKNTLGSLFKPAHCSLKESETLFYLSYFSKGEFNIPFDLALQKFKRDPSFRKKAIKAMTKYIFPEVHKQDCRALHKSLNKKYFAGLSLSKTLVLEFNNTFLASLFFLSRLSLSSPKDPILRLDNLPSPEILPNFFHQVISNNDVEIQKMFSEWDNLLKRDKIWKMELSDKQRVVRLIDKVETNIKKPNFKFPWSVYEVRNALLEAFFWMNEHVHVFDAKLPFVPSKYSLIYLLFPPINKEKYKTFIFKDVWIS